MEILDKRVGPEERIKIVNTKFEEGEQSCSLLIAAARNGHEEVKIIIITIRSIGDHDDCESRGDDVENVVTRLLGQLCPTAMEFSEVKPFDRQKLFTLSC